MLSLFVVWISALYIDGLIDSRAQADLYCSERNSELKPLNDLAKAQLARELRSKKLSLKFLPEVQESSDLTGLIRFKNGGGLYIPGTIDLFLPPSKHRGTPTLIRTKSGKSEELVRPSVDRQRLRKIGIKPPQSETPISPCNYLNE